VSDNDPTMNQPTNPEDAITVSQPEQSDAPSYAGDLEPDELGRLQQLQQASSQAMMQIGQLEARKFNLLKSIQAADSQAQAIMNKAADRLGVPQNQKWSVGADGKVFVVEG
jgi:hypothetical protein